MGNMHNMRFIEEMFLQEKELRRKLLEAAPRRTSSRLETKRHNGEPEVWTIIFSQG